MITPAMLFELLAKWRHIMPKLRCVIAYSRTSVGPGTQELIVSDSVFNLRVEETASQACDNVLVHHPAQAAAVCAAGATLSVPPARHARFVHPEAAHLALTAADLERERGRPLSKYERNMMIFNWLHTLDDAAPF
ncbi:hypothetical protein B5X24_HaOG212979 [Helicoverpa armigera]|uniref:Uncharacterized protein n=1 Tax=Helicoverpa armigera TaxID=29058 RepID=A0A2W1BFL4_HELAM|nr:hypothetical protein B5X24_HaOG212979 [Helicoverpa armigera]